MCPICRKSETERRTNSVKLPDPKRLDWIPDDVTLGRGTKPKDLRGIVFGDLKAERVVGKHESGSLLWECLCTCGNKVTKKSSSLTTGKSTSCGCIRGTVKTYRTVAPNKGKSYTIKADHEHFGSRKAWGMAVKKKKGDSCEICGWSTSPCDAHHIVERNKGGKNTIENSLVLCPNHHRTAHTQGVPILLEIRAARARYIEKQNDGKPAVDSALAFCQYAVLLLDYENDDLLFRALWISLIRALEIVGRRLGVKANDGGDIRARVSQIEYWSRLLNEEFDVPYGNNNSQVLAGDSYQEIPKDMFRMATTLSGETVDCRDYLHETILAYDAILG
jgi:5-methylcytosine-specific restriction endonuclease McrA